MLSTDAPPSLGDMVIVYERSSDGVTWSAPVVIDSTPLPNHIDKPTLTADRARQTARSPARAIPISRKTSWPARTIAARRGARRASLRTSRATAPPTGRDVGRHARLHDRRPRPELVSLAFLDRRRGDVQRPRKSSRKAACRSSRRAAPSPPGYRTSWHSAAICIAFIRCGRAFSSRARRTAASRGRRRCTSPETSAARCGRQSPSTRPPEASSSSWIDAQDDPTATMFRLYAAQSDDGGATFLTTPPARRRAVRH